MKKMLVAFLLALTGCGGVRTVAGDTYSTLVENDGMPTWVRRDGGLARFEYFHNGGRWLEAACDESDWTGWLIGLALAKEHPEKVTLVEPRMKWVRYDVGAAWRGLERGR